MSDKKPDGCAVLMFLAFVVVVVSLLVHHYCAEYAQNHWMPELGEQVWLSCYGSRGNTGTVVRVHHIEVCNTVKSAEHLNPRWYAWVIHPDGRLSDTSIPDHNFCPLPKQRR